jgi:hypothetical protein
MARARTSAEIDRTEEPLMITERRIPLLEPHTLWDGRIGP